MNQITQEFVWRTQRGENVLPSNMDTNHLFYSVQMIWNHTAPEKFKFRPFKEHSNVSNWPIDYRRDAVIAFCNELSKRKLTTDQTNRMAEMAKRIKEAFPEDAKQLQQ